jgi:hypothetical protein
MLVGDGVQIDFLCRLSLVARDMSSPLVMNLLIFCILRLSLTVLIGKFIRKRLWKSSQRVLKLDSALWSFITLFQERLFNWVLKFSMLVLLMSRHVLVLGLFWIGLVPSEVNNVKWSLMSLIMVPDRSLVVLCVLLVRIWSMWKEDSFCIRVALVLLMINTFLLIVLA